MNPKARGAFVDTSIQYLRLLYSNAKKRDTERDLSAYTLICSQTVYREFFIALTKAFDFVTSVLNDRGGPAVSRRPRRASAWPCEFSWVPDAKLQKVQFVLALLTEILAEKILPRRILRLMQMARSLGSRTADSSYLGLRLHPW